MNTYAPAKYFGFILCILVFLPFSLSAADSLEIKSPDGNIAFRLLLKKERLQFAVDFSGKAVIEPSPLYFGANGISATAGVFIGHVKRYQQDEQYPVMGVHALARNHYRGAKVIIKSKAGDLELDIRVFNDGAAYRQILETGKDTNLPAESTVFQLPAGSTIWYHDLNMHYESVHVKKRIDEVREGEWVAPPASFRLPGGAHASITEACLLGYSGMALQSDGRNGLVLRLASEQPTSYPYKLRYAPEDTLRLRQPARAAARVVTPWRVVLVGKDLNALVNSDVVTNLNPPADRLLFPDGIRTSWIRPGRAVWKYLDGGGDGTVEVMKHFTDDAAALGFQHNILEGFWSKWTDAQLKDLVDYSAAKGVGIWLWKHSKSLRNPASRDSFFRRISSLGVTGVKIDFFDHEAKEVIDLYEAILREAASYHLLCDFHGADKPTGLSRTYPNEMTREAVKGMEASKLEDRATHETTIPFTRWLAGPAEYTVLHFGERRKNTTWAHQVASAAILSAPLLTYAANPDSILSNPTVNIIKKIPAVWDETIVLPSSEVGRLAVYARRKGKDWCLAIMNGTTATHIRIPLDFLKGKYKAAIAKDEDINPAALLLENKKFSASDVIVLDLRPGGGYIAWFSKDN